MNLTSRTNQSAGKTLTRCPSCETPSSAGSLYCGVCGCDLAPQSDFTWHEDRFSYWAFGSIGYQAG